MGKWKIQRQVKIIPFLNDKKIKTKRAILALFLFIKLTNSLKSNIILLKTER